MTLDPAKVRQLQAAVGVTADGVFGPATLDAAMAKMSIAAPNVSASPSASTYDRAALEAELGRDEGDRLRAYKDSRGNWTIGIGRNLDGVGTAPLSRSVADVKENGVTSAERDILFNYDIDRTEVDLDRKLPWWRNLDPVRQRVLMNMCFNLGITRLLAFVNTLAMVKEHRFTEAAKNMMFSKWAKQVGSRAERLREMMRTGAA